MVTLFVYVLSFLTHHNLQGSQTHKENGNHWMKFLTHHNLQGSQTSLCGLYFPLKVSYPS